MTDEPAPRAPLPWTPSGVIDEGWNVVRRDPTLILVAFLVFVLGSLVSIVGAGIAGAVGGDAAPFIQLGFDLLNLPIAAYFAIGWIRYLLRLLRGEPVELGLLFTGGGMTLRMVGVALVFRLGVVIGLLLLIVPGMILAMGWWVCGYELVDRDRGVFASLGGSWRLTRGHRWNLVLLWIFHILIGLLGLLFCVFGVFVSFAILAAADTALYLRLRGEKPVAGPQALGAQAPPPPAPAE